MSSIIIKNGNICELDIPLKYAHKLYEQFAVRHPNAFYLRTRVKGMANWDGKVKFITKTGQFKIGLLPAVYEACKKLGLRKVNIIDMRKPVPVIKHVQHHVGNYKLRPEQVRAVKSVLYNKVGDIPFYVGVLNLTVNFGKTLVMASLYLSFKRQLKTLLITNDSDWLQQAKLEFKSYLPQEDITYIQGKVDKPWTQFNIGMVQSLSRNLRYYQRELTQVDMVLVDEADQAGSKTYQSVLTHLYNTRVRIGLSGTIYMSKLAKDKLKNMTLESFFGKVLSTFSLKQSIEKGYSTNTVVKSIEPKRYYGNWQSIYVDYDSIYKDTILDNPAAKRAVYDRLKFNLAYGRIPALVVCKFVRHAEKLYNYLKKKLPDYRFACVHVNTKTKMRRQIMQDFREGKIDILVSTTIIARGKNFPLLKYMLNAASMDAKEKTIQFLGRLVRTNKSKNKAYLDDLIYPGDYLRKHGYHRRRYYKEQHLKVLVIR